MRDPNGRKPRIVRGVPVVGGLNGSGAQAAVPDVRPLALPPESRQELFDQVSKLTALGAIAPKLGAYVLGLLEEVARLERNLKVEAAIRTKILASGADDILIDHGELTDEVKEAFALGRMLPQDALPAILAEERKRIAEAVRAALPATYADAAAEAIEAMR